jgi:hypothetical protein
VGLATVLATLMLAIPPAKALDFKVSKKGTVKVGGHDRFEYLYLTPFPVDETGLEHTRPSEGDFYHRLRLAPGYRHGDWKVETEADFTVYHHLYGGDSAINEGFDSSVHDQARGFRPFLARKLYAAWRSPIGLIKAGMMESHWGLGLLANEGARPTGEFATPWFGDVVLRAGLVTPFLKAFTKHPVSDRLFFAGFFDVVYRDENASLIDGDVALQGALSLFYRIERRLFAGVYVAIRDQEDAGGTSLEVVATDLFVKLDQPLVERVLSLYAAVEGVYITGKTDRVLTEGAPEGTEVRSGAVIGRLGLRFPALGLRVGLEAGWASSDDHTGDDTTTQFRLDPDYQPSLLMFRHVLGPITGHGADRAGDPSRVGTPAAGTGQFPTYGSLRNVIYVQPVVAYRPFPGEKYLQGLQAKVGLLWARTAGDFTDPYNSFRDGGLNQTYLRVPTAGHQELGYELNVSVGYRVPLWRDVFFGADVLYGHLFPGRAFADATGDRAAVDLVQVRATATF